MLVPCVARRAAGLNWPRYNNWMRMMRLGCQFTLNGALSLLFGGLFVVTCMSLSRAMPKGDRPCVDLYQPVASPTAAGNLPWRRGSRRAWRADNRLRAMAAIGCRTDLCDLVDCDLTQRTPYPGLARPVLDRSVQLGRPALPAVGT